MSDSTRILALGVPLRTAEGEELTLRFSLLALKRLEDDFGSILAAEEALNLLGSPERFAKPAIGPLGLFLAAGTGLQPDQALSTLDGTYDALVAAVFDAWSQAWAPAGAEGKAGAGTEPSPGLGSTTAPPSNGAVPTPTSGG